MFHPDGVGNAAPRIPDKPRDLARNPELRRSTLQPFCRPPSGSAVLSLKDGIAPQGIEQTFLVTAKFNGRQVFRSPPRHAHFFDQSPETGHGLLYGPEERYAPKRHVFQEAPSPRRPPYPPPVGPDSLWGSYHRSVALED